MNFEELEKILAANIEGSICPVCGTPYIPFNRNQKTCGTKDCKRQWRNQYFRERNRRMREEDLDAFREYRAEAQRKTRAKKRAVRDAERRLDAMQEYVNKTEEKDKRFEDGLNYGKRQVEKTLALVPKIDVSGFEKEREK